MQIGRPRQAPRATRHRRGRHLDAGRVEGRITVLRRRYQQHLQHRHIRRTAERAGSWQQAEVMVRRRGSRQAGSASEALGACRGGMRWARRPSPRCIAASQPHILEIREPRGLAQPVHEARRRVLRVYTAALPVRPCMPLHRRHARIHTQVQTRHRRRQGAAAAHDDDAGREHGIRKRPQGSQRPACSPARSHGGHRGAADGQRRTPRLNARQRDAVRDAVRGAGLAVPVKQNWWSEAEFLIFLRSQRPPST
jgi:hypothetical protein